MDSHQGAHTAKEAGENDVLVSGLAWSDTMSRFCCKPGIGGAEACAVCDEDVGQRRLLAL